MHHNPLHPSVEASQKSTSNSLKIAVKTDFDSPTRIRVPQPGFSPSSKWNASMGRPNELRPISFDLIGYTGQGIPMRELHARSVWALATLIEGADDQVFRPGMQRITLKINWPGYSHVNWIRSVEVVTTDGQITRAQLASQLAAHFSRFIERAQYEQPTSKTWHIGPKGVHFEQLVLVALWNLHADCWQADVAADFPL